MAPTILKSSQELNSLIKNPLVVLYFTAAWCGPCKAIAPALENLSEQYATSIEIVKIDLDMFKSVASTYKVTAVPTFIYLNSGSEVNRVKGADLVGVTNGFQALLQLNPNAVKNNSTSVSVDDKESKEVESFIGKGLSILNSSVLFKDYEVLNGVNVKDGSRNISDLVRANPEDKEHTAVMSDADSQLLVHIPLTNTSKIYSILIKSKTTQEDSQKPNVVKIWSNRTRIISFDDAESDASAHHEVIDEFINDWVEIKLKLVKFQKVSSLDIFFDGDDEDYNTIIDRILIVGIDGEPKQQGKIEKIEHEH